MKAIDQARIVVFKRASAMLSWLRPAAESPAAPPLIGNDVETVLGGYGIIMTPGQDLAFFARSSAWRCTTCGKVHTFEQRVSVAIASPCPCAGIEFEPQRDNFAAAALSPEQRLPSLLTQ